MKLDFVRSRSVHAFIDARGAAARDDYGLGSAHQIRIRKKALELTLALEDEAAVDVTDRGAADREWLKFAGRQKGEQGQRLHTSLA